MPSDHTSTITLGFLLVEHDGRNFRNLLLDNRPRKEHKHSSANGRLNR